MRCEGGAELLSAHFGVVQTWLERGCVASPREMAQILTRLSWGGPLYALGIGVEAGRQ